MDNTNEDNNQDLTSQLFAAWQEQLTASMKSPEVIERSMEVMEQLQQQFFDYANPFAVSADDDAESSPSPAASDYSEYDSVTWNTLLARIAVLEARVGQLEAERSNGQASGTTKTRSSRAKASVE